MGMSAGGAVYMSLSDIPNWAWDVLRCPDTAAVLFRSGDRVMRETGTEVGRIEDGMVRLPMLIADENVRIYREVGGSHFWERSGQDYAMSALDTPVYHRHLEEIRPPNLDDIIVDVGGGDGRNALPWLEKGHRRVIVVDAVGEGLARFRARIAAEHPAWLDRLLLIEGDARRLPIKAACARTVMAIESLFYLNEDYELGLRQCRELLADDGKLLVAERDYEGGLLLQLLYRGIRGMLEGSGTRTVIDEPAGQLMRSRCFTEQELVALLSENGLAIQSVQGISLMSVVLGWLRNRKLIGREEALHLPAVSELLGDLGRQGRLRRCHVVVARKAQPT